MGNLESYQIHWKIKALQILCQMFYDFHLESGTNLPDLPFNC